MASTRPPSRILAALTVAGALLLSACGGSPPRHAAAPPTTVTTLMQTDRWSAPRLNGPPSAANFCTVLTAMYRHEAQLPLATTPVKEQILRDYVRTVPEALSAAPPAIEPAARTYLTSVASILSSLAAAGLDYKKIKPGSLTALLLDPQIKAAGNQVLAYSQTQCHFAIGGA